MSSLKACMLTVVILVVGALAFAWSGIYDIGASTPHSDLTVWLLAQVRDRSIAFHGKTVQLPAVYDEKLGDTAFPHYHAMCRYCHGAPGYPRLEFAGGLNPGPPALTTANVQKRTDAELYWIAGNGIKMTGMPAFGLTHDENEMLGILIFLRRLPRLQPADYDALVKAMGSREKGADDHHQGSAGGQGEHKSMEPTEGEHQH